MVDVHTLEPGGQTALDMAKRVAEFLGEARRSLELALYDVRLPDEPGEIVAAALRDAAARGVTVRIAYNADHDERVFPPPPRTRPELLEQLPSPLSASRASRTSCITSTRCATARRSGPAPPTGPPTRGRSRRTWSSWPDRWTWPPSSAATSRRSGGSGTSIGRATASRVGCRWTVAKPAPGSRRRGEELSHRIATALAAARRRIRIASPVITAGPILGTLAELAAEARVDVRGVVDRTQMEQVVYQWRTNGRSVWKIGILASVLGHADFKGKPSTQWTPESIHDFMHAKVTVADDHVFVGSFNLSRSGEQNAENVLELRDPELAERLATFIDGIRARYERMPLPEP